MEDSFPLEEEDFSTDAAAPTPVLYSPALSENPIGLYGWRKRCLYFLVLLLIVIIIVNLGLTIWILVVLDFNTNGMGNMVISGSGIRLDGAAEFIGPLYAQEISTDQGSPLHLVSQESIDAIVRNGSSLHIGQSSLNISTQCLSVNHQDDSEPLLSINSNRVSVGSNRLEVTGSLGVVLSGPLQANTIQSPANQNLRIQSLSGSVELTGQQGVVIQDGIGSNGIDIISHDELTITSQSGQIMLSGERIIMEGLLRSRESDIYEVCVCGVGGMLYLVPASDNCNDDNGICTSTPP